MVDQIFGKCQADNVADYQREHTRKFAELVDSLPPESLKYIIDVVPGGKMKDPFEKQMRRAMAFLIAMFLMAAMVVVWRVV